MILPHPHLTARSHPGRPAVYQGPPMSGSKSFRNKDTRLNAHVPSAMTYSSDSCRSRPGSPDLRSSGTACHGLERHKALGPHSDPIQLCLCRNAFAYRSAKCTWHCRSLAPVNFACRWEHQKWPALSLALTDPFPAASSIGGTWQGSRQPTPWTQGSGMTLSRTSCLCTSCLSISSP